MEDMDKMLKCRVCLEQYDTTDHRPLLLPACGHTFCTSCLDSLYRQMKIHCPGCRKNNAVTPVSTLPVNYVVLSLAQSMLSRTTTQADQTPSEVATRPRSQSPPPPHTPRHHTPLHRSASTVAQHYPPHSSYGPRTPQVPPSDTRRSLSSPRRMPRAMTREEHLRHIPHVPGSRSQVAPASTAWASTACLPPNQTSWEVHSHEKSRNLQEELDFQMAVHLTFCKDASHGHDDPMRVAHRWQYPEEDDISAALSHSFTNMDLNGC